MTNSYKKSMGRAALVGIILMASATLMFGQASFAPFYGKDKVKWDKHRWQVYRSKYEEQSSALSSYFELMDRLLPNFLSILSPQTFRGTRILLK